MNRLTTLNRNVFKTLIHLVRIDLFDNQIDYLPETVFSMAESLKYMYVYNSAVVTEVTDTLSH